MNPIHIGLLGIGTVGSGTFTVLKRNAEEITRRAGRPIEISVVADRDLARAAAITQNACQITADAFSVVADPNLEIIVELIGGTTVAKKLVLQAIAHGKHVVTANKALLATHGSEIFARAREQGVIVAFEAAVAGGIPIIKAVREGLAANHIQWIAGIINGTTNFILSEMREKSLDFATTLRAAQELGYAEANPNADIDGIDAGHKITILASLAFGIPVQFSKAHIEGIRDLNSLDIRYAEQFGYRVKLLGITKRVTVAGAPGIELRVHPALIPAQRLIANVEGAMNAVMVQGDAVGTTLYYGKGAGAEPTASAVIADLVDVTRLHGADPQNRVPYLAFQPDALADVPIVNISEIETGYYLRLTVEDRAGVLADLTRILAAQQISINAMMQRQPAEGESQTDIILLTHVTKEKYINAALAQIKQLPAIHGHIIRLRCEELR